MDVSVTVLPFGYLEAHAGEYRQVIAASRHPAKLIRAHRWACSPDEAIRLVDQLAVGYGEPGPEVELVAGAHGHCVPPGHVLGRPNRWLIQIPAEELGDQPEAFARLRVGVVLHEVAHWMVGCALLAAGMTLAQISAFERDQTRGHGPLFVRVLDDLVDEWEPATTAVPSLAVE